MCCSNVTFVSVTAVQRRGRDLAGTADRHGLRPRFRQIRKTFADNMALESFSLAIAGRARQPARAVGLREDDSVADRRRVRAPGSRYRDIDGKDIVGHAGHKRNMGMVFQSYSLFPNLTVKANIAFGLRVRSVSTADQARRVGEMLERVQLSRWRTATRTSSRVASSSGSRSPGPWCSARGAAARRAVVRPGREGARQAARGDPPAADRARHHDTVRHPRPGGGVVDLRPRRRDVQGCDRAARHAERGLRGAVERVRRPVRRVDERAAGRGDRERDRGGRPSRRRHGRTASPSARLSR